MTTKKHPGFIGLCDDARRERLLQLDQLCRSKSRESLKIRWPSAAELQRDALNDLGNPGPGTRLIGLGDQLSDYSRVIKNGASVISHDHFEDLVVPAVDRSLQASWGNSGDLDNTPLSVTDAKPKRLSSYITISNQLRVSNPLLAGAFIEAQLLSSIGSAIDDAAINGSGVGEPLGILNDGDVLTHTRATAGIDTHSDLAAMEKQISAAHGEPDPGDYLWLSDPGTREALRKLPYFDAGGNYGDAVWSGRSQNPGGGPFGYLASVMPTAPNDTLILAQASQLAILDWSSLEIETIPDVGQMTEGFRTMLISGFFNFAVLDPNGICVAQDPV